MNSNGAGKPAAERALEAFVYAPVGLALMALRAVPQVVNDLVMKGCAQLGETEERMRRARMIGQMAVTYGSIKARQEVDNRLADVRRRAEDLSGRLPGVDAEEEDEFDLLGETRRAPSPVTAPPAPPPSERTWGPVAPASPPPAAPPEPEKSPVSPAPPPAPAPADVTERPVPPAAPVPQAAPGPHDDRRAVEESVADKTSAAKKTATARAKKTGTTAKQTGTTAKRASTAKKAAGTTAKQTGSTKKTGTTAKQASTAKKTGTAKQAGTTKKRGTTKKTSTTAKQAGAAEATSGPAKAGGARTTRGTATPEAAASAALAVPEAADLAIPAYDGLSASQVVSRLNGLSPAELEAIRAYEEAGRGRKTVLNAVAERLTR